MPPTPGTNWLKQCLLNQIAYCVCRWLSSGTARVQGRCRSTKTPWQWRADRARGRQPRVPNVAFWTAQKLASNPTCLFELLDKSCFSHAHPRYSRGRRIYNIHSMTHIEPLNHLLTNPSRLYGFFHADRLAKIYRSAACSARWADTTYPAVMACDPAHGANRDWHRWCIAQESMYVLSMGLRVYRSIRGVSMHPSYFLRFLHSGLHEKLCVSAGQSAVEPVHR